MAIGGYCSSCSQRLQTAEESSQPTPFWRDPNSASGRSSRSPLLGRPPGGIRERCCESLEELEAATRSTHRVDRDAGAGELLEVSQDRSLRNLQLGRQLSHGGTTSSLQDEKEGHQAASSHSVILPFLRIHDKRCQSLFRSVHYMNDDDIEGKGTPDDPWILTTPPGKSEFEAHRDPEADPPALVIQVGSTQLRYHLRCLDDLHAMLTEHGDWMSLGNADEQKPVKPDTVEAWGRSADNPIGDWYGFKKGLRGRFGNYVPPVLEVLGLAEVEHNARNNSMRAL